MLSSEPHSTLDLFLAASPSSTIISVFYTVCGPFLSLSVLFLCAQTKLVLSADKLFWEDSIQWSVTKWECAKIHVQSGLSFFFSPILTQWVNITVTGAVVITRQNMSVNSGWIVSNCESFSLMELKMPATDVQTQE